MKKKVFPVRRRGRFFTEKCFTHSYTIESNHHITISVAFVIIDRHGFHFPYYLEKQI